MCALLMCIVNFRFLLKYWLKIISDDVPVSSLVKNVYNGLVALNLEMPDQVTWVSLIKNMLEKYGFGYVWRNHKVARGKVFMK